ncbi:lipid-A-disaccharide synthase [Opacimonas viscosa]|uniref:Lipid-A-disaccharide synthase n=1 Tax=Opacimonas viscosa TaxID=2961944 RepID=A0AA42BNU4_9ALTE|nr:lipid-A-disaccharide synthase [Opacimonas viscosa]MCP3427781.1 lipid-A-disaccharide synthase [Opacimonas viscosa]
MAKLAPKIVVVCAEPSGDMLAEGLVRNLKSTYPNAEIRGIGGPLTQGAGLCSWFDMNELSVMGLVEVLKHLPRLLKIRRQLLHKILDFSPDIYIGVDAPDFNLPIETKLKNKGIKTLHYVSPTVWAWREGRMHKIKKAADHVLGLFPFEAEVYEKYGVPYTFVGHPMADAIPLDTVREDYCQRCEVPENCLTLAILPGSRAAEVATLLPTFLDTLALLQEQFASLDVPVQLQALIPAANSERYAQIKTLLAQHSLAEAKNIVVLERPARDIMLASHAVLLSSGTATLEAMLCQKPMIAAYTMSKMTYRMMRRLYKPDFFALPNILADELLVPEVLQEDVNPVVLSGYLSQVLLDASEQLSDGAQRLLLSLPTKELLVAGSSMVEPTAEHCRHVFQRFAELHQALQRNADLQAHHAVCKLLEQNEC